MTTINIPNFEHYLIFEDGIIINSNTGNMMTPQIDPESGYTRMLLSSKFNKQKGLYLHRLLGLTFLPNPHNYPQIDHIDRDTSNNSLSNLRWVERWHNSYNRNIQKNNTSGIKGIREWKPDDITPWVYEITHKGKRTTKYFETKNEAIIFKKEFLENLNLPYL